MSRASDAVIVGTSANVGIDIDIGIYAVREWLSRRRAALVTNQIGHIKAYKQWWLRYS